MDSNAVKPLRLILLLIFMGLLASYLPHPALGPSLPKKLVETYRHR